MVALGALYIYPLGYFGGRWFIERTHLSWSALSVADEKSSASTTEDSMRALVLGAAGLALSAGAASAQALYPSDGYGPYGYGYAAPAPLYDYAGPASAASVHAAPHGYGPLIYTPQLYARTPAFP